jgi:hypothetical protein
MDKPILKRFHLADEEFELDVQIDLELLPWGEVMARFVGADGEWVCILDRELVDDRSVIKELFGVVPGFSL